MESIEHYTIKKNLYDSLVKKGFYAYLEIPLPKCKPDILVENVCGKKLAIEIQRNSIPHKTMLDRMKSHTENGAYTLWLIPESVLMTILYKRKWCELIQRYQNGVVFLPYSDGKILPARIDLFFEGKKKAIEYRNEPIEITDLLFETAYGVNLTYVNEWWLENYLEMVDIMQMNQIPRKLYDGKR